MPTSHKPPRFAIWLLGRLLEPEDAEFLIGDLEEEFRKGRRPFPRLWLYCQAFLTLVKLLSGLGEKPQRQWKSEGTPMLSLWQDVKYGVRELCQHPGFTLLASLTLAIGLGANVTIFSWINGVLLNPIPGAAQPSRLIEVSPTAKTGQIVAFSYPVYRDYRDQAETLNLAIMSPNPVAFSSGGEADRIWASLVSTNVFEILQVQPLLGRFFLPSEEEVPGRDNVAVISHGLWQQRFGGDPSTVGREVFINGNAFCHCRSSSGRISGS